MRRTMTLACTSLILIANATTISSHGTLNGADPIVPIVGGTTEPWNLHHGVAVRRNHSFDLIERVKSRSVSQLEESLAEEEPSVDVAGILSTIEGFSAFKSVLADPRVARIYAGYRALDKQQARDRSITLFEKWLVEHDRRLQLMIEAYARSGGYELTIELDNSNYALAASLFLVSRFGEPSDLIKAVERWRELGEASAKAVRDLGVVLVGEPFNREAGPDDLVVLNLYLVCLQTNLDSAKFTSVLREKIKLRSGAREVPYPAWEAQTLQLDFTRFHPRIAADGPEVSESFMIAESWTSIHVHHNPAREGFLRRAFDAVVSIPPDRRT